MGYCLHIVYRAMTTKQGYCSAAGAFVRYFSLAGIHSLDSLD